MPPNLVIFIGDVDICSRIWMTRAISESEGFCNSTFHPLISALFMVDFLLREEMDYRSLISPVYPRDSVAEVGT